MINKIKLSLTALFALSVFVAPIAVIAPVSAQGADIQGGLNCGADLNLESTSCATQDTDTNFQDLLTNVINIISVIVGVVAVIMIIYGGFRYITSGGDSGNVGNAKNTILYAIIGLIIVALSQFIVHFVLNATGDAVG